MEAEVDEDEINEERGAERRRLGAGGGETPVPSFWNNL